MYTIHIFHSLTFKNKLQKELYQFFEEIEHAVFEDLDQMKELITNKVEHLNTEHKRCKPIKISFGRVDRGKNIFIFGLSAIGTIHILKLRDFSNVEFVPVVDTMPESKSFFKDAAKMGARIEELISDMSVADISRLHEQSLARIKELNEGIIMTKDAAYMFNINEADVIPTITPIKCHATKELLHIGDKVKNERGQYGYLAWDEYFNRYHIRTESGGSVKGRLYTKVEEIQPNNIDTTNVECRRNPNKKKF